MGNHLCKVATLATALIFASAAHAQKAAVLSRLDQIAATIGSATGTTDQSANLTEACKLIGFGIWKDSANFAPQSNNSPLHLAVTQGEIRDYSQMYMHHYGFRLGDMEAGFDEIVQKLGAKVSVASSVNEFLSSTGYSKKEPVYYLQFFLHALSAHRMVGSSTEFTPDSQLDPIQSLLLMRVISEDICTPIRRYLKSHPKKTPLALVLPHAESVPFGDSPFMEEPPLTAAFQVPDANPNLPGWAEDLYVGIMGNLYGGLSSFEKYADMTNIFNASMSVIKYISSYVKLDGDVALTPGPPLVRTLDTSEEGAKADLKATFKIIGDPTSDTLKDLRTYLSGLGGFDLDQPKTAMLSGVETEWTIGQSTKYATQQIIQTQTGKSVNLSKVVTDDNGVATVPIAGKPQFTQIDQANAIKVQKHILITVTPQLQSNNVLGDAINIALGVKSGPIGAVNIIGNFIQHMKIIGTVNYDLQVTDWVQGEMQGNFEFEVQGSYNNPDVVMGYERETLRQTLKINGMVFKAIPIRKPSIDTSIINNPDILQHLSDEQKAQLAAALQKANSQLSNLPSQPGTTYQVDQNATGGEWKFEMNDQGSSLMEAQRGGEATHGAYFSQLAIVGSDSGSLAPVKPDASGKFTEMPPPGVMITLSSDKKFMYISLSCSEKVKKSMRHTEEDTPSNNYNRTTDEIVGFADSLDIDASMRGPGGGFKVPYDPSNTGGTVTIPCKFRGQPATLLITYALTQKKKS